MKRIIKSLAIFSAALLMASCSKAPKVAYKTEKVAKLNITTSITATGTIEPVTKVEVGTQVSGIIDKIYVDYNSVVRRGDVIAELDTKPTCFLNWLLHKATLPMLKALSLIRLQTTTDTRHSIKRDLCLPTIMRTRE